MLTVDYKRKMGEVIITQKQDDKPLTFKLNVYWCNGLAAFVYEYKNEEGETMCQLMNFFADKQHIENLINSKTELFYGEIKKISLNMWYEDNKYVLKYFTKMGYKVTCYYKEPTKTNLKE